MATDAKIHDIAVAFVLKAVLGRTDWPHTVIGKLHPSLAHHVSLEDGELVIISAFFSSESWHAFTARGIISRFRGVSHSIDPSHGIREDFGNFKGYGPSEDVDTLPDVGVVPREIATITSNSGGVVQFEFATLEES